MNDEEILAEEDADEEISPHSPSLSSTQLHSPSTNMAKEIQEKILNITDPPTVFQLSSINFRDSRTDAMRPSLKSSKGSHGVVTVSVSTGTQVLTKKIALNPATSSEIITVGPKARYSNANQQLPKMTRLPMPDRVQGPSRGASVAGPGKVVIPLARALGAALGSDFSSGETVQVSTTTPTEMISPGAGSEVEVESAILEQDCLDDGEDYEEDVRPCSDASGDESIDDISESAADSTYMSIEPAADSTDVPTEPAVDGAAMLTELAAKSADVLTELVADSTDVSTQPAAKSTNTLLSQAEEIVAQHRRIHSLPRQHQDCELCQILINGHSELKGRSKKKCAASLCGNERSASTRFFKFPSEPSRLTRWKASCEWSQVDELLFTLGGRNALCDEHFDDDQFLGGRVHGVLIRNALPTIFRHTEPPSEPRVDLGLKDSKMQAGEFVSHSRTMTVEENLPSTPAARAKLLLVGSDRLSCSPIVDEVELSMDDLVLKTDPSGNVANVKERTSATAKSLLISEDVKPSGNVADAREEGSSVTAKPLLISEHYTESTSEPGCITLLPEDEGGVEHETLVLPREHTYVKKDFGLSSVASEHAQREIGKLKRQHFRKVLVLEQKLRRLSESNEKLRKQLAQKQQAVNMEVLAEHVPPVVHGLVALKYRYENQPEPKSLGYWPPGVKEWALSLYEISPRAYTKVKETFILPSHDSLRKMSREIHLKKLVNASEDLATSDSPSEPAEPFDYSKYIIITTPSQSDAKKTTARKRDLGVPNVNADSLSKKLKGLFD